MSSSALCSAVAFAAVQPVTGVKLECKPPTDFQCRYASSQPKPRSRTHYYDVLELSSKASQTDIKGAYYRLSRVHHPDVNKQENAKAKFSEIAEAYEILGNTHKRRLYDRGAFNLGAGHADAADDDYTEAFRQREGFGSERRAPPTGWTSQYNFDEFYRQHYAESIKKDKEDRAFNEEAMRHYEMDRFSMQLRAVLTCLMFLSMILVFLIPTQEPALTKSKLSESDKKS